MRRRETLCLASFFLFITFFIHTIIQNLHITGRTHLIHTRMISRVSSGHTRQGDADATALFFRTLSFKSGAVARAARRVRVLCLRE